MMTNNYLPIDRFYHFEAKLKERVYLRQPVDGKWIEYTWGDVGREARLLAQAILNLNLPKKSHIGLLSKNCAHWLITDLAIWMAGHISVPLYPTSNGETIDYVLNHCQAPLLFVGKLDDWNSQINSVPKNVKMVSFPLWPNTGTLTWHEFVKDLVPMNSSPVRQGTDISTIIYTSGTTGKPKGVVHSFETMSANMEEALKEINICEDDCFISYLPLSHVAERLLIELGSLYSGGMVSFVESIEKFKDNLIEIRPTIFLAVPRIWLKFQQGILQKLPQKKLNILLGIPFINNIIKHKIKKGLGLDRVHLAITGAAAISPDLLKWFARLDINIYEVYGMTENFGISTFNFPGKVKFGTVGTLFPRTQLKISETGEILTKSMANMIEYYKESEKTKEMIDPDGWIHTGDLGELTKDNYLKITGRVKDLFETSKGKYVSPSPIEGLFSQCEYIEQVCVVGDGLPQPLALVTISESGKQIDPTEIESSLNKLLIEINQRLPNFERLTNIVIIQDEWSVESGILTPTLKLKRNVVEKIYAKDLTGWSECKSTVVYN